jgi:dihydrofolate reductase
MGPAARIIRDVAELRTLKGQAGKNMYVVGGATLVASLLNEDLIDQLRLIVHPVVLGQGQSLFGGVNKRLSLELVQATSTESGRLIVTYQTRRKGR